MVVKKRRKKEEKAGSRGVPKLLLMVPKKRSLQRSVGRENKKLNYLST